MCIRMKYFEINENLIQELFLKLQVTIALEQTGVCFHTLGFVCVFITISFSAQVVSALEGGGTESSDDECRIVLHSLWSPAVVLMRDSFVAAGLQHAGCGDGDPPPVQLQRGFPGLFLSLCLCSFPGASLFSPAPGFSWSLPQIHLSVCGAV